MAAVSAISFSLFNFVGDPVNNMVGQDATREQRVEIRQKLGLDDPVLTQYTRFIGNVLQGDFGLSYRIKRPVSTLILERLPATLELVFVSALIALVVGIGLGVYTGIKRDTWVSRTVLAVSLVGVSLPTFIIGIALIYLFAVHLRWLPSSGRSGKIELGFWKTSLLSIDGWRADYSACNHAVAVSANDDFKIGAGRDVRGDARRLYQICPRARVGGAVDLFCPRAAQYTGAGNHGHWAEHWRVDCIFSDHRDGVSVARYGVDVHPVRRFCRRADYGGLSDFCGAVIRGDQSGR